MDIQTCAIGVALGSMHRDSHLPGFHERAFSRRTVVPLVNSMGAIDRRYVRLVVHVVIWIEHRWMKILCSSTGVLSQLSRDLWTASPLGVGTEVGENNRYGRPLVVRLVTTLRDEDGAEY